MSKSRVILYGHQACPGTRTAAAYFATHGIEYTCRDIGTDRTAWTEFGSLGGFATPLLLVDGQPLLGFDPAEFETLLRKLGEVRRG